MLLLSFFAGYFLKSATNRPVIVKELSVETTKISDPNNINLKTSYFDDFRGVWGDGTPDGGITWKAGDSQYAERSMPTPIVHPLTKLNQEQERIVSIRRSDISNIFIGEDVANIIDRNIAKYGNLFGGFFSRRREIITSLTSFDVDSDGVEEDIVETGNMGGNHFPHNGYIIKNNVIIWSVRLDAGSIDQAMDGNGFYIKNVIRDDASMCCSNGYRRYRLIYDKTGKFIPVWEQDVYYLRFDK